MDKLILKPPKLILVVGQPCSGKSTISCQILERLSATYLSKDTLADAFTKRRSGKFYSTIGMSIYSALLSIAGENLEVGNSVLIESAARLKSMQSGKWWENVLCRVSAPVKTLVCSTTPEVTKRRMEIRDTERDRDNLQDWGAFLREQWVDTPLSFNHLVVNTLEAIDIGTVLTYIGADLQL